DDPIIFATFVFLSREAKAWSRKQKSRVHHAAFRLAKFSLLNRFGPIVRINAVEIAPLSIRRLLTLLLQKVARVFTILVIIFNDDRRSDKHQEVTLIARFRIGTK